MSRRRGTGVALAVVALVVLAGCGRNDFNNDPRPAVPLEVSVEITNENVQVSPPSLGAGLVNFTIANNSDDDATFQITGPTDGTSDAMPPDDNAQMKIEMRTGTYRAAVFGKDLIEPARIEVGADRPASQNDLLLP